MVLENNLHFSKHLWGSKTVGIVVPWLEITKNREIECISNHIRKVPNPGIYFLYR